MTTVETPAVRAHRGDRSDVAAAATVLSAAFGDYPWTELTVASDHREDRLVRSYELFLGEIVVPHGRLWVAEGRDGQMVGAAGWLTPECDPPPSLVARVEDEVRALRGDRAIAAARAEQSVRAVAARSWQDAPHWFLGALGVLPSVRGLGMGTALLAAGLEAVDADGAVARLETSLAQNLGLYRRFGFTVSGHVTLPSDVPCWLMQRDPPQTRQGSPPRRGNAHRRPASQVRDGPKCGGSAGRHWHGRLPVAWCMRPSREPLVSDPRATRCHRHRAECEVLVPASTVHGVRGSSPPAIGEARRRHRPQVWPRGSTCGARAPACASENPR